jgi:hypothetical protein
MLPTAAEIQRSLQGAFLLARGDPAGMGWFDLSFGGFWRSFAGPLLAAPLYALLAAERYVRSGREGPVGPLLASEVAAFALDVAALPLLAILLVRFLALGSRYVPLVVATNWAAPLQAAAFLAAVVVGGAVPPLRGLLPLLVWLAMVVYQWYVVRTALGSTGNVAAAVVVLNFVVTLFAYRLVVMLLGLGGEA